MTSQPNFEAGVIEHPPAPVNRARRPGLGSRWRLALIPALLLAGACDDNDPEVASSTTTSSLPPAETTLAPTSTLAPEATPPPTTTPPAETTTTLAAPTPTDAPTTLPASPETTAPLPCVFDHDTRPDSRRYDGFAALSSMVGTDVDVGDHDAPDDCPSYEREVFRFSGEGKPPGVFARYVEPPVLEDPSGLPVDFACGAYHQLTFGSWMYPGDNHEGPQAILTPELELISGIYITENNEGQSTWTTCLRGGPANFDLSEVTGTENCPNYCIVLDFGDPGQAPPD